MPTVIHMQPPPNVSNIGCPVTRLDADSATHVATTLQALAHLTRLLILSQLRQGPPAVTDLVDAIGMGQSAVSHQLRLLRNLGLVVAPAPAAASSTASTTTTSPSSSTRRSTTANTCDSACRTPQAPPAENERDESIRAADLVRGRNGNLPQIG